MEKIKLLIVDDNKNFRCAVKSFLLSEPEIDLIGEAENGSMAIIRTRELNPDLILMDIRMPKMNGIEAATRIKKEFPETSIILCSFYDKEISSKEAAGWNADACLSKKSLTKELMPLIKNIYKKKTLNG